MGGFGLAPRGRATLTVPEEGHLSIENASQQAGLIRLEVFELDGEQSPSRDDADMPEFIGFTLRNASLKPVPLIIPNVMNPNLSPKSNSRVYLPLGQEILIREKGSRYVRLVVDESIPEGQVIDVPRLIRARKKERGLK